MSGKNILSEDGKASRITFGISSHGKPFYTFDIDPKKCTPSDVIIFTKKLEKIKNRIQKEVS